MPRDDFRPWLPDLTKTRLRDLLADNPALDAAAAELVDRLGEPQISDCGQDDHRAGPAPAPPLGDQR